MPGYPQLRPLPAVTPGPPAAQRSMYATARSPAATSLAPNLRLCLRLALALSRRFVLSKVCCRRQELANLCQVAAEGLIKRLALELIASVQICSGRKQRIADVDMPVQCCPMHGAIPSL